MTALARPIRLLAALAMIAAAGALLLPWQASLLCEARGARYRTAPLDLSLREQVGQSGFLAALSGFRSPLAAFLWIEAHSAWEKTEWGRMQGLFETVTTLQPHTLLYWDIAAWHMAWNASAAALQDARQKSPVLRERARRQYIDLGRGLIEGGIRNNPDSSLLWERLGILLRDKLEDHPAAADAFAKAASLPGAAPYVHRMAAYEEAKTPGRERHAYESLRPIYLGEPAMHTPLMLSRLRDLEHRLGLSPEACIPDPVAVPSSSPR